MVDVKDSENDIGQAIYRGAIDEVGEEEPVVAMDVDNTFVKGDSGARWFTEAGVVEGAGHYGDIMEQVDQAVPRGHSNQLVTFLHSLRDQNPGLFYRLHEHVPEVELPPREGLNAIAEHRYENGLPNIASSAGYMPVVETTTNGYFDMKIAGSFEGGEPVYNGQGEKDRNLAAALAENGVEENPVIFLGDSNGDLQGFRLADRTGGYGIAIGESPEVLEKVDEASVYVIDNSEGHTVAALTNELAHDGEYRISPRRLREEYGFDISGDIVVGELVDETRRSELEDAADSMGVDLSYG